MIATIPRLNEYVFPAARDRLKHKPATIFNGWGNPRSLSTRRARLLPWTLHDLRRTFATNLAALGTPISNNISSSSPLLLIGVPSAAKFVANVRRKSWSVHGAIEHVLSNAAFGLPQPLKMVVGLPPTLVRAAGKR